MKNTINIIRHITLFILICSNINCGKNLIADIPAYIEIKELTTSITLKTQSHIHQTTIQQNN